MVGQLLWRGLLAGVLAGLLAVGFAFFAGEPSVDRAISFESAREAGAAARPEIVSRDIQRSVGLAVAGAFYGAGIGGLFALAFAFVNGRLGPLDPRATAMILAGLGFLLIALIPALKYPPNPPAIGDPDTIGLRTALYFSMVIACVLAAILAALVSGAAAPRLGGWNAGCLGVALALAGAVAAALALAPIDEVPDNFPADLLWRFRLATLGTQAMLWASLGLIFGLLAAPLPGLDFSSRRFVAAGAPARR